MRRFTHEDMSNLLALSFEAAEQDIFSRLRGLTDDERLAVLKTLDALNVVHKQLIILLDRAETAE